MATRFEIALHGENAVALRAAAEEALNEVERLEAQLSLYRPTSEIARVNVRAAREPVRVTPAVFRLLEPAARLSTETGGAFDITIGPLMKCWGFVGAGGAVPDPAALADARACVGMNLVELDAANFTVRFARDGVMLDLGAIGKGYAIDVAANFLREAGVTSALLHGGTSTAYAIGHPPESDAWKVAIERPAQLPGIGVPKGTSSPAPPVLAVAPLRDEALSVSTVWGKSFDFGGQSFGHVIDPRTGHPISRAFVAVVTLPSATETDALSTALLTRGQEGDHLIHRLRPNAGTLLVAREGDAVQVSSCGIVLRPLSLGRQRAP